MQAVYEKLGAPTGKQLYVASIRQGLEVSKKQAQDFVNRQADKQLFAKAPTSDSQTAARSDNSEWQADLIDLKQFKTNCGAILIVINVFNRKIAMEGLPNKTAAQTQQAFRRILNRMPKPQILSSDLGNEFSGVFNTMLEEKGIAHRYKDPRNINSLAVLDKAIQTVKTTLFQKMTRQNTKKWDGFIKEVEDGYNETINDGALGGNAPNDVEGDSESSKVVRFQLMKANAEKFESNHEIAEKKMTTVKDAGQYRVALKQETFDRGFKPRYENQISTVREVRAGMVTSTQGKTVPVTTVKVVPAGTVETAVPDFRGRSLRDKKLQNDLRPFALELYDGLSQEELSLTAAARLMGPEFARAKPSTLLFGQFLSLYSNLFKVSGEGTSKTVRRIRIRARGKQPDRR